MVDWQAKDSDANAPAMNNNSNNFYPSPLSPDEVQRQMAARRAQQNHTQGRSVSLINTSTSGEATPGPLSAMSDIPMSSGDSLGGMTHQDTQQLHRRRSVPRPFSGQLGQDSSDRRLSLLDLSAGNAFQDFDYSSMISPGDDINGGFGDIDSDLGITGTGPFNGPNLLSIADQADFANLTPDLVGDMNMMAFSSLNVGNLTTDPGHLHLFDSPTIESQFPTSLEPVSTDFVMDLRAENGNDASPSVGIAPKREEDELMVEGTFGPPEDAAPAPSRPDLSVNPVLTPGRFSHGIRSPPTQEMPGVPTFHSPVSRPSGPGQTVSQLSGLTSGGMSSTPVTPATIGPPPPEKGAGKSIYSKSGFDMLRALWYVATRKNPKLNIGAVDMSCAFVVCDVTLNDCPIIYVSDNFQNLTGYNRHEIVGKNCRFLQSPMGNVEAGSRREFVENEAVFKLKEAIARGDETQQSLINYRKGGSPFLNLLTMIPIPWDTDEIRYFIGFQIDLVECPEAISGNQGNNMTVSYQHSEIPPQISWEPPNQSHWELEHGQTLATDDVSALLQSFNPKGATSDWHKQSWDKMLLENADDVIHVLSLKGVFLYVSPSCRKVLEYEPSELIHAALTAVCHPSDIIPVTRELKEAQPGTPVNFVFRIRSKNSGYVWFESHGSLFMDQGKGRKSIILVGRKRPVFSLRRQDLEANGGIGDSEIWAKVSTSGMFLSVSSHVRSLLDLLPGDLEGKSMQDLMRRETRPEFGRTMEKARQGRIVSCKHEIQNKRGQVLQALTTFYPGDNAHGGEVGVPVPDEPIKPTFLLAQIKLLKASSRSIAPAPSVGLSHTASLPGGTVLVAEQPAPVPAAREESLTPQMQGSSLFVIDNMFDELSTTRATSWQFELRQMERVNRALAEELAQLLSNRKKRKRRKGGGMVRDCANCHTRSTPEWRRGPSGNRDLCNSCGLRWAKQVRFQRTLLNV